MFLHLMIKGLTPRHAEWVFLDAKGIVTINPYQPHSGASPNAPGYNAGHRIIWRPGGNDASVILGQWGAGLS